MFTPSHFLTFPRVCNVIPELPLSPHPCDLFALVASPKLGLRHFFCLLGVDFSMQGRLTSYSSQRIDG